MTTAAQPAGTPEKDYSQPESYPVLMDFEAGRLDEELYSGYKEQRLAFLSLVRRTADAADRTTLLKELVRSLSTERRLKAQRLKVDELTAQLAAQRPEVPAILQYVRCAEMYVRDMVSKTEQTTAAIKAKDPESKALGFMHWLEHEAYVARDGLKYHGGKLAEHLARAAAPAQAQEPGNTAE